MTRLIAVLISKTGSRTRPSWLVHSSKQRAWNYTPRYRGRSGGLHKVRTMCTLLSMGNEDNFKQMKTRHLIIFYELQVVNFEVKFDVKSSKNLKFEFLMS